MENVKYEWMPTATGEVYKAPGNYAVPWMWVDRESENDPWNVAWDDTIRGSEVKAELPANLTIEEVKAVALVMWSAR